MPKAMTTSVLPFGRSAVGNSDADVL